MENMFVRSAKKLSDPRCLAVIGVMVAASVLLELFAPIKLDWIKINFAFLPLAALGMLYGPTVAVIAAIPCDLLGVLFSGGGILPVYTLVAMFEGLVYGVLLYNAVSGSKARFILRTAAAQTIVILISHMVMNTSLNYMYGFISDASLWGAIGARAVTNLIALPVNIALLLLVLPAVNIIYTKTLDQRTRR
jgi:ECF transporter S component (folate family)